MTGSVSLARGVESAAPLILYVRAGLLLKLTVQGRSDRAKLPMRSKLNVIWEEDGADISLGAPASQGRTALLLSLHLLSYASVLFVVVVSGLVPELSNSLLKCLCFHSPSFFRES